MQQCPENERLEAFCVGSLSEAESEVIAEHLDCCDPCTTRIDSMSHADTVILKLRAKNPILKYAGEAQYLDILQRLEKESSGLNNAPNRFATVAAKNASVEIDATARIVAGQEQLLEELPQSIGDYKVVRLLGRGAFGSVYECYDPVVEQSYAIKVPHREGLNRNHEFDSFFSEARLAAKLDHENIVRVQHISRENKFIAMQFISGATLSRMLKERERLPTDFAVKIVRQVASAIHHAHKLGVTHRDLKPANILIRDSDQKAFVADFGLAIHESEQAEFAGEIAGTRAYMSPEQWRGEADKLDGRADIFALGVILYECLTGKRPFKLDPKTGKFDFNHNAVKPIRQYDESISPHIAAACMKCLESETNKRFSSASDLIKALRPDSAGSLTVDSGHRKIGRRHVVLGLTAATLVGGAGLGFYSLFSSSGENPTTRENGAKNQNDDRQEEVKIGQLGVVERWKWDNRKAQNTITISDEGELTIATGEESIILLGEIADRNFNFSIDFFQHNWDSIGIVFGFGGEHFETIVYHDLSTKEKLVRSSRQFTYNAGLVQETLVTTFNDTDNIELTRLEFDSSPVRTFELVVRDGNVVQFGFDGNRYPELIVVPDFMKDKLPEKFPAPSKIGVVLALPATFSNMRVNGKEIPFRDVTDD